jgi:uncharacterized protein (TIGR02270 family)
VAVLSIVSQHAEEAAFLWTVRDRAVRAPWYWLKSVAALDERVEAHLDGLRIAGDMAWPICQANLENVDQGGVFPFAVLAFEAGDPQRMREALAAGSATVESRRSLVSALGWIGDTGVTRWIGRLLDTRSAVNRAIGVAACAIRREDPGPALAAAIADPDPALRFRALRAVGEIKRRDLLDPLREHLTDEDEACRFWAAWSLTLLRERSGLTNLTQWIGQGTPLGRAALPLSMRAMSVEDGRDWIRMMAKDPELQRTAVMGAGFLGDPTCVNWLLGQMEKPELSRLAGDAFSMITGADLQYQNLDRSAPAPVEELGEEAPQELEEPAKETGEPNEATVDAVEETEAAPEAPADDADEDGNLPWPDPVRIREWWDANQGNFQAGKRHLAGQALTERAARQVLLTGNQRQRAAAAFDLALREPDELLFEVRARGSAQRRQLLAGARRA